MSTYLQGVTDVNAVIQPTAPNLQFNAQLLQASQSAYNANKKKVSDLYGSILNSSMTREDNIAARDQMFKMIQGDIKQMGSMDFSLDENVQSASNVFKSIYKNKGILKDMVWTDNFNNEMSRAESFKNCVDPDKCGGQYWQTGIDAMHYKRAEFKNADTASALNFDDVKYVPYNSTFDAAIKDLDKAKIKVTRDVIHGGYIMTTTNGQQVISPLAQAFQQSIGKDPRFHEMYKTQAYVDRNNFAHNAVATGQAKDLNEGFSLYFKHNSDRVTNSIKDEADRLHVQLGTLEDQVNKDASDVENGLLKEGTKAYQDAWNRKELYNSTLSAKEYIDFANKGDLYQNSHAAMSVLNEQWDNKMASHYLIQDINKAAETLANRDFSVTQKESEFALAQQKFDFDTKLEQQKSINAQKEINLKAQYGAYEHGNANATFQKTSDAEQAVKEAESLEFSKDSNFRKKYKDRTGVDYSDTEAEDPAKRKDQEAVTNQLNTELIKKKQDANEKLIKAGMPIKYHDLVTGSMLGSLDNDNALNSINNTAEHFKVSYQALVKSASDPNNSDKTLRELAKEIIKSQTKKK